MDLNQEQQHERFNGILETLNRLIESEPTSLRAKYGEEDYRMDGSLTMTDVFYERDGTEDLKVICGWEGEQVTLSLETEFEKDTINFGLIIRRKKENKLVFGFTHYWNFSQRELEQVASIFKKANDGTLTNKESTPA